MDNITPCGECDCRPGTCAKTKQSDDSNLWDNFRKDRRFMAWTALVSIIISHVFLMTPLIAETRVEKLADPITWFYMTLASIVGMYLGFKTWARIKKVDD